MLPHKERIRRVEFQYILASGKRYNSPHLLLYCVLQTKPEQINHFAFSVSKKVAKLATDRNKLRRRGYSIISKYKNTLVPGHFLLFSFKKDSKNIPFAQLEKEILGLLRGASVLS